jgi:hypothetical protein
MPVSLISRITAEDYYLICQSVWDITPGRVLCRTVTVGYDTVINNCQFDSKAGQLSVSLESPFRKGVTGVILAMGEPVTYEIDINGQQHSAQQSDSGAIQLKLFLAKKPTSLKLGLKK